MGYIVIGKGQAGTWSQDASAVRSEDADLLDNARAANLYTIGQRHGACSLAGDLRDGAWLVVVSAPPETLNSDPSVIAYCDAP